MFELTIASRSLNLITGAFIRFAYCSSRVNSFMLSGSGWLPVPRWVPYVRWNRCVLSAMPICSAIVKPVAPVFKRIGGCLAAALFHGPFITAPGRMRVDFVRRAVFDVNHPAVCLPTWNARCVMVVCIRNAAIMLFLVLVLFRIRRGIAPQPELLYELLPLFIRFQTLEGLLFFVRDDVDNVLVQPLLPRAC